VIGNELNVTAYRPCIILFMSYIYLFLHRSQSMEYSAMAPDKYLDVSSE